MQPYFLPYIGYYQLMDAVDVFVVYDNIKYTKKGWINRNRILVNGSDAFISLPLQAASDSLEIRQRSLAAGFAPEKLLNQVRGAYLKAPHLGAVMPLLESVIRFPEKNLFDFILHSIDQVCAALHLRTRRVVSSAITVDPDLTGEARVIATCRALGATTYVNAIGGVGLYDPGRFADAGLDLRFHRARMAPYDQAGGAFVPWLSIVDVLMFNGFQYAIERHLPAYDLIEAPAEGMKRL